MWKREFSYLAFCPWQPLRHLCVVILQSLSFYPKKTSQLACKFAGFMYSIWSTLFDQHCKKYWLKQLHVALKKGVGASQGSSRNIQGWEEKKTRALMHTFLISFFLNSVCIRKSEQPGLLGLCQVLAWETSVGWRSHFVTQVMGICTQCRRVQVRAFLSAALSSVHINLYLDQAQLQRHQCFSEEGWKEGSVQLPDFRQLWQSQHLLFARYSKCCFSVSSLGAGRGTTWESLRLSSPSCMQWGLASVACTVVWQGSAQCHVSSWRLLAH